ncbi:hypothetical protein [Edaphobacter dinghuensis]|uniref:Uncharacterized protein n=1 Tax=Edaphobacter dinghuensis TaxID=1560005 RepID=A0A917M9F7_9BACT|nr:hypothetical protein [Edaphobacter dinghuensis]GGG83547.1 hypothetical protein GCM10011585_29060 [Edaphobacter dinghuensis]
MASERDEALSAVVAADKTPEVPPVEIPSSNLDSALSTAEETRRLELANQHALNRLHAELGWFGKVFGSESHAAIVIAFVMIVLGFGTAIGLWFVAYRTGKTDFWASEAHLSLAAATSALGYVFGRGSKDGNK